VASAAKAFSPAGAARHPDPKKTWYFMGLLRMTKEKLSPSTITRHSAVCPLGRTRPFSSSRVLIRVVALTRLQKDKDTGSSHNLIRNGRPANSCGSTPRTPFWSRKKWTIRRNHGQHDVFHLARNWIMLDVSNNNNKNNDQKKAGLSFVD
jgi:hypothetical protein